MSQTAANAITPVSGWTLVNAVTAGPRQAQPARIRHVDPLVAIMGFFQYMTDGTLMQPLNLTNLILQNNCIVIMALGMLLVIVAVSICRLGSGVASLVPCIAVLMVQIPVALCAASLVCLVCGDLIGAVQGWFMAFSRIPSFIVTLAGMLVFKGASLRAAGRTVGGHFPRVVSDAQLGFVLTLRNSGEGYRIRP